MYKFTLEDMPRHTPPSLEGFPEDAKDTLKIFLSIIPLKIRGVSKAALIKDARLFKAACEGHDVQGIVEEIWLDWQNRLPKDRFSFSRIGSFVFRAQEITTMRDMKPASTVDKAQLAIDRMAKARKEAGL